MTLIEPSTLFRAHTTLVNVKVSQPAIPSHKVVVHKYNYRVQQLHKQKHSATNKKVQNQTEARYSDVQITLMTAFNGFLTKWTLA